jgi:hypothetical protein
VSNRTAAARKAAKTRKRRAAARKAARTRAQGGGTQRLGHSARETNMTADQLIAEGRNP